jgi:hypothetical protein
MSRNYETNATHLVERFIENLIEKSPEEIDLMDIQNKPTSIFKLII